LLPILLPGLCALLGEQLVQMRIQLGVMDSRLAPQQTEHSLQTGVASVCETPGGGTTGVEQLGDAQRHASDAQAPEEHRQQLVALTLIHVSDVD
jgi:hypothetical protein